MIYTFVLKSQILISKFFLLTVYGLGILILISLFNVDVSCQNTQCDILKCKKPKKVRVAFHYITDSEKSENFTKKKDERGINGRKWSKLLVKKANEQLSNLKRNWRSPEDIVHPEDAGFKYVLKKVKYIESDEYANIDDFTERSSYEINEKYGKKLHKMINIYFHQDYFKGMNSGGGITNRGHRPEEVFIKMYNFAWKKYTDFDNAEFVIREEAAVLNHEMGHLLGLDHDWLQNDGMDDTIPYKERSCNSKQNEWINCSNNFMTIPQAIPSLEGSFTACQLAKMHVLLEGKRKMYAK